MAKTTEISKAAEILYRATFDELRFAKQQQWQITYYTLALMGALFGLVKLASPTTHTEKAAWCVVVVAIWGTAMFLVLNLQCYLRKTRARQERIEQTFSPEDRRLVGGEPPVTSIEWFGPIQCAVVTAAAIGTGSAIWLGS